MKKILLISLVALLSATSIFAQKGKGFKGIIIYTVEATNTETGQKKSYEQEVKFYEQYSKYSMDLGMASLTMIGNGETKELFQLLPPSPMGKIAVKITEADVKEMMKDTKKEIKLADETKTICGYTCKKAIVTTTDEDGQVTTDEYWYAPELGNSNAMYSLEPTVSLDGLFLEFTSKEGPTNTKYTAKEVKKGKVKDVDLMMPSDYSIKTVDEIKKMMGGGEEDDE